MSVLVVVTDDGPVASYLAAAMSVFNVNQRPLTVLCWSRSPNSEFPLLAEQDELAENDALVEKTQHALDGLARPGPGGFDPKTVKIKRAISSDVTGSTLAEIRAGQHELVIAAVGHNASSEVAAGGRQPLLRRSPCETVLFYRVPESTKRSKRVLVVATDSWDDQAAFETFSHEARAAALKLTFARLEEEAGAEALELGRRELKRIMRAAGIKSTGSVRRRIFSSDAWPAFLETAEEHGLILVGSDQQALVSELTNHTTNPAIAVIKRAPPLKRFSRVTSSRWKTKLNPADYADMMQGLRRGAVLNADFLIMLGLAAAIASLGLLQDSPAVVIGSMLLAPLMTPMIACGLAIAQGNKKLGRRSMLSIGIGFLLTLAVSFLLGIASPGEELTSQIVSRGNPNILDLLVALFSAAAAAYALARPSIVGAIAGVAIATALVPPLCSTGIALAYREYLHAHGAALLFATNLVAIILGAAVTFRLLGVTVAFADPAQRRWVYRITTVICLTLIILAYPLQLRLNKRIDQGQSQPRTYPLTRATDEALVDFIKNAPEIELVSSGRPSALNDQVDVVLVLSSPEPLSRSYADELVEICRQQMENPELIVDVHCFLNAWQSDDDEPTELAVDAPPDE